MSEFTRREDTIKSFHGLGKDSLCVGMVLKPSLIEKGFFLQLRFRTEILDGKEITIYTFERKSDGLAFEVLDGKVISMGFSVNMKNFMETVREKTTLVLEGINKFFGGKSGIENTSKSFFSNK